MYAAHHARYTTRTGSSRGGQVHGTRRPVRARASDGPGIGSMVTYGG
jgi:hypothetical protein